MRVLNLSVALGWLGLLASFVSASGLGGYSPNFHRDPDSDDEPRFVPYQPYEMGPSAMLPGPYNRLPPTDAILDVRQPGGNRNLAVPSPYRSSFELKSNRLMHHGDPDVFSRIAMRLEYEKRIGEPRFVYVDWPSGSYREGQAAHVIRWLNERENNRARRGMTIPWGILLMDRPERRPFEREIMSPYLEAERNFRKSLEKVHPSDMPSWNFRMMHMYAFGNMLRSITEQIKKHFLTLGKQVWPYHQRFNDLPAHTSLRSLDWYHSDLNKFVLISEKFLADLEQIYQKVVDMEEQNSALYGLEARVQLRRAITDGERWTNALSEAVGAIRKAGEAHGDENTGKLARLHFLARALFEPFAPVLP